MLRLTIGRVLGIAAAVASCSLGGRGAVTGVQTSPAITEQDARLRVGLIAHDSMQGRSTGSAGHIEVTEYLARESARLGLRPGGEDGTYFQRVPFARRRLATHSLSADGESFVLVRDFVPLHPGGRMRRFDGARVVFGGILGDTTRQITREDAADKFVILMHRDPGQQAGNIRMPRRGDRLGLAAAVATVNADRALSSWGRRLANPIPEYLGDDDPDESRPAALAISRRVAERLLGQPADPSLPLGTTGTVVHGDLSFRAESLMVRNVIAVLPGGDAKRAGEYVALGAHSDHLPNRASPVDHDSLRAFNTLARAEQHHLGKDYLTPAERAAIAVDMDSLRALGPGRRDSIFNGADDDASGTTALIEIAERMAAAPERPAHSILFVWHAAEELGLIGSRHFTEHPTVSRDAIVAQLNLDMIARGSAVDIPGGGSRYLQVIGWRRLSSELGEIIERENRRQSPPFAFDLQFDAPGHPQQLYCRSDHYNYARYGIPVAFFTTGLHLDYHEVTDEWQYLDYAKLVRVARLVHDVARALANLDHGLVVDGAQQDPEADCLQ